MALISQILPSVSKKKGERKWKKKKPQSTTHTGFPKKKQKATCYQNKFHTHAYDTLQNEIS